MSQSLFSWRFRRTSAALDGPGICLGIILGAGLCLSGPVEAQNPYELDLGSASNATLSGTAALTTAGGAASGTYTYYGDGGVEGPLPAEPNTVQVLYAYGNSQASISSGMLSLAEIYNTSTLNLSGGYISFGDNNGLDAYDSSVVNIDGGLTSELSSQGNSVVNLSSGGANVAYFGDSSTLHMTGGSLGNTTVDQGATADISGGMINAQLADLGMVNVSGGTIQELDMSSNANNAPGSTANISSGTVGYLVNQGDSIVNITGGIFNYSYSTLVGAGTSVFNLYGTGFQETLIDPSNPSAFQLTGTLADGQALNATYDDEGGSLVFHAPPVPEASATVSFGLLLALGLGSVLIARRKKQNGEQAAPIS